MKAIMMSIRPQHVANILNEEKTIEIRKKFPKDYVGWVYIYCTKAQGLGLYCLDYNGKRVAYFENKGLDLQYAKQFNGKVAARFWCDKVEDYVNGKKWSWKNGAPMWGADNDYEYILKPSCLTEDELYDYCEDLSFKAIHITKLEIFDKPKEIFDFYKAPNEKYAKWCRENSVHGLCIIQSLIRAPQSWCYIENI